MTNEIHGGMNRRHRIQTEVHHKTVALGMSNFTKKQA